MTMIVHTEWNTSVPALGIEPDESKHLAMSLHALGILESEREDLFHFLNGMEANVLVGEGMFSYSLPFAPRGAWIGDEDMAQRLSLLPWVTPSETKH